MKFTTHQVNKKRWMWMYASECVQEWNLKFLSWLPLHPRIFLIQAYQSGDIKSIVIFDINDVCVHASDSIFYRTHTHTHKDTHLWRVNTLIYFNLLWNSNTNKWKMASEREREKALGIEVSQPKKFYAWFDRIWIYVPYRRVNYNISRAFLFSTKFPKWYS